MDIGENMEKYCKSCGAVFNDLKFKLCPYCGGELDTRYGRQPIPRKLRHEVFKRDGYRCRECGASKDETSLEIDHIVPVARGGTNNIDNLQTLCRECNRMKHTDEWVGGEESVEIDQNGLNNEKIEYQFKILKLKEKIKNIENKKDEKIKQQKEYKNKEKLFKKLYVKLDEEGLSILNCKIGSDSLSDKSKNKILKYICSNNSIKKIEESYLEVVQIQNKKKIKKEREKQKRINKVLKRHRVKSGDRENWDRELNLKDVNIVIIILNPAKL